MKNSKSVFSKPSLSELLEIENSDDLLGHWCHGSQIPAWSLIRVAVIRVIMSDLLFTAGSLVTTSQVNKAKIIKYLIKSSHHNFARKKDNRSDICFFTTGLGNYIKNGQTRERLVGYFANSFPDQTMILQENAGWNWHANYEFDRIEYAAPFDTFIQLLGRIKVKPMHTEQSREILQIVERNASAKLDYDFESNSLQHLMKSLARKLAIFPYVVEFYTNWFLKRGIRLLMKEDACYGGRSVPIIHAARLVGVVTAEYQHGAISKGHDAYNVAALLANSEGYRKSLPDFLLTYGGWWSQQSNMPIKKIVIGNPHLEESLRHFKAYPKVEDRILILGDGIETKLYLEMASNIAQIEKSGIAKVVFRPHPLERSKVMNMDLPVGVSLDSHADIYPSLMASSVVISELSTGLFEAVGLVDRVLLWETDKSKFAFPEIPFQKFSSISELADILGSLNSPITDHCRIDRESLWASNWRSNYYEFVRGALR